MHFTLHTHRNLIICHPRSVRKMAVASLLYKIRLTPEPRGLGEQDWKHPQELVLSNVSLNANLGTQSGHGNSQVTVVRKGREN